MSAIRKICEVEKSTEGSPVVVTISTSAMDRDGDVIDQKGWDLDDYEANPVVLWAHDNRSLPIGRAKLLKGGDSLRAEVEFAPHAFAKEVEAQVRAGFVRAASVGFRPKLAVPMDPQRPWGAQKFLEQKLLEFSFVPVPSNAEALVESKTLREEALKAVHQPQTAASPKEQPMQEQKTEAAVEQKTEAKSVTMTSDELKATIDGAVKSALATVTTTIGASVSDAMKSAANAAPHIAKHADAPQREKSDKNIVGRVACAAVLAKQVGCTPVEAASLRGDRDLAEKMEAEGVRLKDLGIGSISTGAALVPQPAGEMIELLRPFSAVIPRANAVTMASDTLRLPRQTAGASANYVGEGGTITPDNASFDEVVLSAKKLVAASKASREFIRDAGMSAESFIQNDLLQAAALKMDLAALTGTGTAYEPRGLVTQIAAAHQSAQTGTTYANWITDLNKCVSDLETDSVPLPGCFFVMSPRTKNGLWGLQDADGNFRFRDEMMGSGTLYGYPYAVTPQISITGAASRLFFVSGPNFVVGVRQGWEVDVDTSLGFLTDQVIVRLVGRHDFALRHPEAGRIIHTVTLA
jgi:HK97 family phage major capsid protein/HK97 family phage prohead protease